MRRTGELRSLTSLRGVAAMAVVMQHFSATAQEHAAVTIPSLVPHGYVAVDFFFVLSGFIMSYTYLADFQAAGLRAYGPFLMRRVARVVPLNVAVLVLIGLAGLASLAIAGQNIFFDSTRPVFDFAANLLMLQGIGIGTNLNGPSWSISVEFAAYLCFPLFAAAVFGPRLRAIAAALAAALVLGAMALSQPRLGLSLEAPPLSLLRCFTEFTLGMAAFRVYTMPGCAALLGRDAVTIGLSLAAAASLAARYDLPAALLFPAIVVGFAANTGIAARIAQWKVLYFLGVISYSLYLIHNPFRPIELDLLRWIFPNPLGAKAALLFALLGSLSVIPFAWLTYTRIERPGRTLLRRKSPIIVKV